jgi:hypothetical protein
MNAKQAYMKYNRAADNVFRYGIFDATPLESPDIRKKSPWASKLCAIVPNTPENIQKIKDHFRKSGYVFVIYGRGPWKMMDHDFYGSRQQILVYRDKPPTKECPYVAIYQKLKD